MTNKKISGGLVHEVPADIKVMLYRHPEILDKWESLTPLARNEWICWTISVKKEETRAEHVTRMYEDLKKGKRRTCCWYGCIHRTDKKVSPSVQHLVINKRRDL